MNTVFVARTGEAFEVEGVGNASVEAARQHVGKKGCPIRIVGFKVPECNNQNTGRTGDLKLIGIDFSYWNWFSKPSVENTNSRRT